VNNGAFIVHKASFCALKEAFVLIDASWVNEKGDPRSARGIARETGVALGRTAAAFVERLSAVGRHTDALLPVAARTARSQAQRQQPPRTPARLTRPS
jgi:hypothetical protein